MLSFSARFHGTCAEGDHIAPGDSVVYVGDDLTHTACVDKPAAKPATVCPTCFIEKPCECDD